MRLLALLLLLAAPAFGYDNPAVGLHVPDPPGWEVRTGEEGALVRYYAPPAPGPRRSIGVSVEEIGEVQALDASMVHAAVRRLAAELEGFKLLGSRQVRVAGLPGYRVGYQARAEGHTFRATQVMAVQAGRLYVLTLTTPDEGHESAMPAFEALLKGVTIQGPG